MRSNASKDYVANHPAEHNAQTNNIQHPKPLKLNTFGWLMNRMLIQKLKHIMPYSRSSNFFISTICITATKNFVYKNIIDSRAANNTHKEMASKVSKYPMPKIKNQKMKKRNMSQFETKQPLQIHSTETNSHRVQPCERRPPIQSNIVILIRPSRIGLFQRLGTHVNIIKFYPKSGFRR